MHTALLPALVKKTGLKKIRFSTLRGLLFRLGIAALPLVAVILLCLIVFSGLGRSRSATAFDPTDPLLPQTQTTQALVMESAQETQATRPKLIQADFRRLGITHATIHVPD